MNLFKLDNYFQMSQNRKITQSCLEAREQNLTPEQYFLQKLLAAAQQNSTRSKGGYRYDGEVKLFSSYLRMIVGPLAYDTIHRNLEAAVPSLSSTNRYISSFKSHIVEGVLRCDELKIYLESRGLPLIVSLSEDGTRVQDKVQYDSTTNQLIGFVPPINEINGMPIPLTYPARSAEEILEHFSKENAISSYINIVMAQPLAPNSPPFCLLLFGSDNSYSLKNVKDRWAFITSELKKIGITVLTWASDSEPRYNSTGRALSGLGNTTIHEWFSCSFTNDSPHYIQDIVHIATKLRNFLLSFQWKSNLLPFGSHFIRLRHLYDLIETCSKDRHLLTVSTLCPTDRQNFESVRRMCSVQVLRALRENIKDSEGTVQYLQIIRDNIDAFFDNELTPLQRVRKLWYSLFLVRMWRDFISSNKHYKLKDNFLTMNCYSCLELNAHSLVLILIRLKNMNRPDLFLPHLYDSQTCESTFRQYRSMVTAYSVITNCTVKESLSRTSKIQLQNDIIHNTTNFIYPRIKKKSQSNQTHQLPTPDEICNEILFCKRTAIATARRLGLVTQPELKSECIQCKVQPLSSTSNKRMPKKNAINTVGRSVSKMPDLKNIQLRDYDGKLKHSVIDEKSPYAEIKKTNGKRIIVKKTSLCWLLRKESHKVSSDRHIRSRTTNKITQKANKQTAKSSLRPFNIPKPNQKQNKYRRRAKI